MAYITYISLIFMAQAGKYTMHGSYRINNWWLKIPDKNDALAKKTSFTTIHFGCPCTFCVPPNTKNLHRSTLQFGSNPGTQPAQKHTPSPLSSLPCNHGHGHGKLWKDQTSISITISQLDGAAGGFWEEEGNRRWWIIPQCGQISWGFWWH